MSRAPTIIVKFLCMFAPSGCTLERSTSSGFWGEPSGAPTPDSACDRVYKHPTKQGIVVIAGRPGVDVPQGTWNNILKQAGLQRRG